MAKSLEKKLLLHPCTEGYENIHDTAVFAEEKILSLIAARIWDDAGLFSKDISISVGDFSVGSYDEYNEEMIYNTPFERYVMLDEQSFYERLRELFTSSIDGHNNNALIYTQYLSDEDIDGEMTYDEFISEYPIALKQVLRENGCSDEDTLIAITSCFPRLEEITKDILQFDPTNEYAEILVHFYFSNTLGEMLSDGTYRHQKSLKKVLKSLSFLRESECYNGVWYAYEILGFDHSSCDENFPVCNICSYDIANIAIIKDLVAKYKKKKEEMAA